MSTNPDDFSGPTQLREQLAAKDAEPFAPTGDGLSIGADVDGDIQAALDAEAAEQEAAEQAAAEEAEAKAAAKAEADAKKTAAAKKSGK